VSVNRGTRGMTERIRLLTYDEAADVLRCSQATVKRRVAEGALDAFADGRLRRIREDDLVRFVAERVVRRGGKPPKPGASGRALAPGARLWDD
jgi:excisionase family DNA binding protein